MHVTLVNILETITLEDCTIVLFYIVGCFGCWWCWSSSQENS